jgi:hypothetical protein
MEVLEHRPSCDRVVALVRQAAVLRKSLSVDGEAVGIPGILERLDSGYLPVELSHDRQEVATSGTDVEEPARRTTR